MTSPRSRVAVLLLPLLLAGCGHTVTGSATPADRALAVLPTEDQISAAVGNRLNTFGFEPFVGGVEILPDGYRTDADASPIGCVAVTDTAPRLVYEAVPVVEAARQSYFNPNPDAKTSGADAAAVRLATADDATDTFAAFVQRWQQCDGSRVVKRLRGRTDAEVDAEVSGVTVDGPVLVAAVSTRQRPGSATSFYERGVGVEGDTIVEVSLALTAAARGSGAQSAAAVVRAMLDEVSTR